MLECRHYRSRMTGVKEENEDQDQDQDHYKFAYVAICATKPRGHTPTDMPLNMCASRAYLCYAGYECKEFDGSFMMAFPDGCAAMEWALTLQMALLALPWSQASYLLDPDKLLSTANTML